MKSFLTGRLMIAGAAVVLAGCTTEGPLDPSVQPDLPPPEAFDPDLSVFAVPPAPDSTTGAWTLALGRIDALVADMEVLAVPLAALTSAAAATPTRSGSIWSWPVSFDVIGEPYDGDLRASVSGGQYGWDLVLNAPLHSPTLTNYLWMAGVSDANSQQGAWYIADSAAGTSEAIALLTWELGVADAVIIGFASTDSTAWTYVPGDEETVLSYAVNNQERYAVTWSPADGAGNTWTAETNETVCWNADRHDVACEPVPTP